MLHGMQFLWCFHASNLPLLKMHSLTEARKGGSAAAGLQWQVGQFAGDGPRAIQPRMPVLPTERLESTAEAAWGKGSSTGAR